MPDYRAVANGNWSALATWQDNGSGSYLPSTVLPGAADTVRTNNFTVTLDINTTILFYTNGSATGVTAGGTISINSSRTLTVTNGITHGTGNPVTINGVGHTITINASWNLGNGLIASFATNSSGHTVNFNGNFFAPTTSAGLGYSTNANNNVSNFTGNVVGNAGSLIQIGQTNNTLNFIGNITGAGTGRVVNTFNTSTPTVTVTGIVDTGTGTNNIIELLATSGVGTFRLNSGFVLNRNGVMAILTQRLFLPTNPTYWQFQDNANANKILASAGYGGYPVEPDVRNGVIYGPLNNLTGTLVPDITPQDIFTAIANSSDPIAVRLRNVATVQTTGDQIAAAL